MKENFKRALQKIKYQPEKELTEHIFRKIDLLNRDKVNLGVYLFPVIGIISLIGFIPIFKILISDFTQSGFYEYVSLAFSIEAISVSWKELAYSVAESLPTTSLILSLSIIFIFLLSLRLTLKQITKGHYGYHYYLKA
ncbi:hypothetical protein KKA39_01090 [Patescibacteria group bacterium]|nr:hypothetical protein [Patescibacteria group bacterium]MBU1727889.1 hypothetical protein [Patescibacteria group bacterium]